MPFFDLFRRRRPAPAPTDRRDFFRRISGAGLAVAAAGTLGADDAWAAIEERAARFGITPGTVVDAQGRPVRGARMAAEPFVGEIMIAGFNYAPQGWALCNGALLSTSQNSALFSLLGVQFGGNGSQNFALPDLQGRAPIGQGPGAGLGNVTMGQKAGAESVTMIQSQMPLHNHVVPSGSASVALPVSSAPGTTPNPIGAVLAQPASSIPQYVTTVPAGTEGSTTLTGTTGSTFTSIAGGSQPLPVRDPYLGINFCIALQGVFPQRP